MCPATLFLRQAKKETMADVKHALFSQRPSARKDRPKKVKNGLGWNRLRLTIPPLTTVRIDTGVGGKNLVKGALPLGASIPEVNQPALPNPTGQSGTSLLNPLPGTLPASRLMVLPMMPISPWIDVTMPTEPSWSARTQTAWITLANTNEALALEINLLVWDPLRASPGNAATYTSGEA